MNTAASTGITTAKDKQTDWRFQNPISIHSNKIKHMIWRELVEKPSETVRNIKSSIMKSYKILGSIIKGTFTTETVNVKTVTLRQ